MFRKTTTVLALAAFCLGLAACSSHAQFGEIFNAVNAVSAATGDVPDKTNTSATSAADVQSSSELVRRFVAAQKFMLDAQISFARSFNLADQVKLLQAEKKALSSGSVDKDALEKSVTVSERARKAIEEKIKAQPALSASSKAHYARGLVSLVGSVSQAKKLPQAASRLMEGAAGNPLSLLSAGNELATGIWVAKETPGYLSTLVSTTQSALSFGKLMGISLPKNADALLTDL